MSLSEFQSHNGAIAASEQISAFDQLKRFNPTMVRLLLTEQVVKHLQNYSFNPTMVRLLPRHEVAEQGHNIGFNPTMVRLLPARSDVSSRLPTRVSIPQWCDCCVVAF